MNVELNAFVVIDDWQAVVNRTVANTSIRLALNIWIRSWICASLIC